MRGKDTAILFHIEHSKPIEIGDFVKTLNAISGLFSDYVRKKCDYQDLTQAKLYVEKIEDGCIDIHLCEVVSASIIPFIENANTLMDFSKYIKDIVTYYTKGIGNKPALTIKELINTQNY